MPASSPTLPPIALVGAGALGTALVTALAARGYPITAVISRRREPAEVLARQAGAPIASTHFSDLPRQARLVLCCVPDDALASVAEELYLQPHDWPRCTVIHTSGALTTDVLEPLAARGAATLSFHPLQTFPRGAPPEALAQAFAGIYVGLEGDAAARRVGETMARKLGAQPVTLARADKARYHLAATLASNFLVTLMALADEVLSTTTLDRQVANELLAPLVEQTWHNLHGQRPEDVLTGPIARGDADTIARHQKALDKHLPHLRPVYAALAAETVRVALRGGQLAPAAARPLLDLLHRNLSPLG